MKGPAIKISINQNPVTPSDTGEVDLFIGNDEKLKSVDEDGNVSDYLDEGLGDSRYYKQDQVDLLLSGKANLSHTHTASEITDFSSAAQAANDARFTVNETNISQNTSDITDLEANKLGLPSTLPPATIPLTNSDELIIVQSGTARKATRFDSLKPNPESYFWTSSDFVTTVLGDLSSSVTGSGASSQAGAYGLDLTEKALGVVETDTGTTATGRAALGAAGSGATLQLLNRPNLKWYFGARLAVNILSSDTERYFLGAGIWDGYSLSTPINGNNGAFFRYQHDNNGGQVECVCIKAGVEIASDSGFLMDLDYHNFEIEMDSTEAKFFINGVLVHIETNQIPFGPAERFGYGWKIQKTNGTSQRNMYADWYYFGHTDLGAR
jgi:hypothetical protein